MQVRPRRTARRTDIADRLPRRHRSPRRDTVPRQMVIARDQAITETDLHFVARRRVPRAIRCTVTDSRERRARRHRTVNTLMSATARTETVTARVGAIERHPQLYQATRRIPERPGPVPVQVIQQARRVTPKIILR